MKRYISGRSLQSIVEGSFEDKRRLTMEAIDLYEKHHEPAHALPRPLSLVATFESHAVVADAAGGVHRFSFVEGKVSQREVYDGFASMTEEEAKLDRASLTEQAARSIDSGVDLTQAVLALMKREV